MSSEIGQTFGMRYHRRYSKIINEWATKLEGKEVTDDMFHEWGADLKEALSEELEAYLLKNVGFSDRYITMPSKETMKMFSQIAAKFSLQYATKDLLDRLARSATFDAENPPEDTITAAIRPMRPSELSKRSPQTLAQVFDMAKDRFSAILGRHFTRNNQFTGRRRWVTDGKNSRHASLNGKVRNQEQLFSYKGEEIATPRPVGGAPAHWSNCSCHLEYETRGGRWVS